MKRSLINALKFYEYKRKKIISRLTQEPNNNGFEDGIKISGAELGGHNRIGKDSIIKGNIRIGYATVIGRGGIIRGDISIGNYCQLAARISIFSRDHAFNYVTSYNNRQMLDGLMKSFVAERHVRVGNDVLVGVGATILKGIKIGNGAVIGAGSLVTRDVPSYAIVAGNPAKIKRFRFNEKIVDLLERLKWWELSLEEVGYIQELFTHDLTKEPEKGVEVIMSAIQIKKRLSIK